MPNACVIISEDRILVGTVEEVCNRLVDKLFQGRIVFMLALRTL